MFNEERNGEHKQHHDDGKLLEVCNFANNKLHGEYKTYKEGKLQSVSHYVNGNLQGEFNIWHSNGQLRFKCNYVNGIMNGNYFEYDFEGNPISH